MNSSCRRWRNMLLLCSWQLKYYHINVFIIISVSMEQFARLLTILYGTCCPLTMIWCNVNICVRLEYVLKKIWLQRVVNNYYHNINKCGQGEVCLKKGKFENERSCFIVKQKSCEVQLILLRSKEASLLMRILSCWVGVCVDCHRCC